MNLQPCKICIWQRWGHFAVIGFGRLAILSTKKKKFFSFVALTALITEVIIAAYHSGIELKLWSGPKNCTNLIKSLDDKPNELLLKILNAPIVKCDEIPWAFLNISMATWNFLISLSLLSFWIYAMQKTSGTK